MCRKFLWSAARQERETRAVVGELARKYGAFPQGEEWFPGGEIPVLLPSPRGKTTAVLAGWGFFGREDRLIYNARSETVPEKPLFARCFEEGRCIVPTHGFFEWDKEGRQHFFFGKEEEPLYFAALQRWERGRRRVVVLTTHANSSVGGVHHRMPLILRKEDLRSWLYQEERAKELLAERPLALEEKEME